LDKTLYPKLNKKSKLKNVRIVAQKNVECIWD
jgi:hypothetical protein